MKSSLQIGDLVARSGEKVQGWLDVAELPGSTLKIPVSLSNGYDNGPILFVNSGIHGSEYNPIEANIRLQQWIDVSKLKGAVLSSLITNLPAFNSRVQYVNPLDGKNVNRCLPGKSDGTISDRLANLLTKEFIALADYVLDLHGGDLIEDTWPI